MSALHRSDVFYAYTLDVDTRQPKSITYLTPRNDPIGLSLPFAAIAIEDQTDSTDWAESAPSAPDTN